MDALLRAKVNVKVVFTGNQEASSAQLRISKVAAAGVNSSVMARYAPPRGVRVPRAVDFRDLPAICASWRTRRCRPTRWPRSGRRFVDMVKDPEGRQVLQAGAELLKSNGELGFVAAEDREYDNYRKFYRTTQVQ